MRELLGMGLLVVWLGSGSALALEVQGHRGARGLVPENTLPAFNAALDLRVDVLELDLHLSRDGEVVVTHDPFVLSEKCRAAEPGGLQPGPTTAIGSLDLVTLQRAFICDLNPSVERFPAQDNRFGRTDGGESVKAFQARGREERDAYAIPSLREVFEFVRFYGTNPADAAYSRRVRFNIELKRLPSRPELLGPAEVQFEAKVVALVRAFGLVGRTTVQSFVHGSLLKVRTLEPAIKTVALTAQDAVARPEQVVRAAGATTWSPDFGWNTASLTRQVRRMGIKVVPYTVNSPQEIQSEIAKGVDGLITDFPNRLLCIPGALQPPRPQPPGCKRFPIERF